MVYSMKKLSTARGDIPWKNLVNLTTFRLSCIPATVCPFSVTQLLDFFESTPLLSNIELRLIPGFPDPSPSRVVSVPHLKELIISSYLTYCILAKHLSIPTGASVVLNFPFSGESSPISDWLPENSSDLNNLSHVTTVNLLLDRDTNYARFKGLSGQLCLYSQLSEGGPSWNVGQCRMIRSYERFNLSNTQRLAVTKHTPSSGEAVDGSPIFQTLLFMDDLRTLTLIRCENLFFIHALNPEKNGSGAVACPNLEEIIICIEKLDRFHISELKEMA